MPPTDQQVGGGQWNSISGLNNHTEHTIIQTIKGSSGSRRVQRGCKPAGAQSRRKEAFVSCAYAGLRSPSTASIPTQVRIIYGPRLRIGDTTRFSWWAHSPHHPIAVRWKRRSYVGARPAAHIMCVSDIEAGSDSGWRLGHARHPGPMEWVAARGCQIGKTC